MAQISSAQLLETPPSATTRRWIRRAIRRIEVPVDYIARRAFLALTVPALLSCLLACAYVLPYGFPAPRVPDEFSYLLGADTFAGGRLANPTHPMWVYFESPCIIHVPTYVSMYYPAQALVLAAGQRFAGHPWYGVLASVVTMCLTMSWAYRAWLPPRWAFLAALISVQMAVFGICPEWTGYWAASYWGGAVAATGGALVLGALGRLRRRIDVRNSILMNSRPFEGLLLAVCATVALFMSVRRQSTPLHVVLKKCVLPGALLLGLTGAGMLYYCWRTTGNAFRLPYQENLRQYIPRRMFIFGKSQPKTYRHAALARFYDWLMRREWSYSRKAKVAAKRIVNFYLGPVLRLAGVMAVCVLFDRRIRPLLISSLAVVGGLALLEYMHIHYAAPIACALIALCVQCLRHIGVIRWRGSPLGRVVVWCLVLSSFAVTSVDAWTVRGWHHSEWPARREKIQDDLLHSGGKHLILVRYSDRHVGPEWVYNSADIDAAPVVWAREMADNAPLLRYFANRKAWLLEPDTQPVKLRPYPMKWTHQLKVYSDSEAGATSVTSPSPY